MDTLAIAEAHCTHPTIPHMHFEAVRDKSLYTMLYVLRSNIA